MAATGDWVSLRIDGGRPFWAKPPLSTWLTAASFRAFGVHEFAARLPSFLLAVASVLLVHRVARRLHGPGVARTSAVVLSTGALFFVLAGGVMTDPALGFATTVSFAGIVLALADAGTPAGRRAGWIFFVGLGLGLLAKGPIAAVLTLGPVAVWAVWKRRVGDVFRALPCAGGTALALAIAVPWYLAAEERTPGFLRYFVVGEHLGRFADPTWTGDLYGAPRTKPRGAIWALGFAAALPWSIFVIPGLVRLARGGRESWRRISADPWAPFLLVWAAAPVVMFTPSGSAMITYVLTGLAPFAILAARLISAGSADGHPVARRTFLAAACVVPVGFAATVPFAAPELRRRHSEAGIVRAWERESGGAGVLVYALEDDRHPEESPSSADFYSRGRVQRVVGADAPEWEEILRRPGPLFVVAKRLAKPPAPPALVARLERVTASGENVLWRTKAE